MSTEFPKLTIKADQLYYDEASVFRGSLATALGKITVRTVQVVDGWIGQIVVDGKPVWESAPIVKSDCDIDESPEAVVLNEARERVTARLGAIFA